MPLYYNNKAKGFWSFKKIIIHPSPEINMKNYLLSSHLLITQRKETISGMNDFQPLCRLWRIYIKNVQPANCARKSNTKNWFVICANMWIKKPTNTFDLGCLKKVTINNKLGCYWPATPMQIVFQLFKWIDKRHKPAIVLDIEVKTESSYFQSSHVIKNSEYFHILDV